MKRVISFLFVILLVLVAGCVTTTTTTATNQRPPGCEDSVIYSKIPDPKAAGIAIQLANVTFVRHYPAAKVSMLSSLNKMEQMLTQNDLTWKLLTVFITSEVNYLKDNYGIELMIVSSYLSILDNPLPINKCDKDILLNHIKEQKMYINML